MAAKRGLLNPHDSSKIFLVVDDEPAIRKVLTRYFTKKGVQIVTASDGREALDKMRQERFDLVLLDIMMPDIGGIEVLEKMRNLRIEVPVVMISGIGDMDKARLALQRGACDYIQKPIDFNYLDTCSDLFTWLHSAQHP